jgi:hypothetical protein
MNIKTTKAIVFLLGVLFASSVMASPATILLFDNFNSENGGNGAFEYDGFVNWDVTGGNIALIGTGFFDIYPENGLYLDLGGSWDNTPGTLTSKTPFTLIPGVTYTLSFDLGGNPYNPSRDDTVQVLLGSVFDEKFTLQNIDPLHKFTRTIHVDSMTTGTLSFRDVGSRGVDSEGLILDNVALIAVPDGDEGCSVERVTASPDFLWPPNHKMRPVRVNFSESGNCEHGLTCEITSVSSNEPENGLGDGDTAPDWARTEDPTVVNLRAERSGMGSGRIYTITLTCEDAFGNSSTGAVNVTVPHDQGRK